MLLTGLTLGVGVGSQGPQPGPTLQPLGPSPFALPEGAIYIPSTPETVQWGSLPNRDAEPLVTLSSGAMVTFDTVSHEGILEDPGRDPVTYFGTHGLAPDQVLDDARTIAASALSHDFDGDGPHIVTGPVAIEGARPGDVLQIEVLSLIPRVPYGVISNRHGKGALPGEFPENDGSQGTRKVQIISRPPVRPLGSRRCEVRRGAPGNCSLRVAQGGSAQGNRLDGEVGYGLSVGDRFVGTPLVGFSTSEYGRDYRVGYGLGVLDRERLHVELGVDAQRRARPMLGGTANGVLGRASLGW